MEIINKTKKTLFLIITDAIVVYISMYLSLLICGEFNFEIASKIFGDTLRYFPMIYLLFEVSMYIMHMHRVIWRYAGFTEIIKLGAASFAASSLSFVFYSFVMTGPEDRKPKIMIFAIYFLIISIFSFLTRTVIRYIQGEMANKKYDGEYLKKWGNIMIIGCGGAGIMLLGDIKTSASFHECNVVCAIDDDPLKVGMSFHGVPIVGNRTTIINNAKKYDVDTIIFAIPTCPPEDKSDILSFCAKTGCEVKTVPDIEKILDGKVKVSTVRKVKIEDLLSREPIKINLDGIDYIKGKTVLVTGGGGSIGSELSRQIAKRHPGSLVIFDIYENNVYDIQNELKREYPDLELHCMIGSVRDERRLEEIFEMFSPEIVFHAAAHKHVPLMEESPRESIKNNVFGTYNTAKTADKYNVKKFVLISTDKAVNPTNIMGASKRICEMIVQYFSRHSNTEFAAVRFGNVLGSNGSVIPLFKKQIEQGGPVLVTHPDIIRYFMTIPEAVSLILEAGEDAKGGEIFVLDMGKPVKILDLAENMIRLSGYEPYKEIPIKFTGLRPGEKLYEELLMNEEGLTKTENKLIYIGKPIVFEETEFLKDLGTLELAMFDENSDIRKIVHKIVPTYNYNLSVAE